MRSGVFVRSGDAVNAVRNERNVLKSKALEPSRWTAWMRAASMAIATASAVLASVAFGATTTINTLIDADNNAATGCSVSTANGAFAGVDRVLNTTVITDTAGYRIQSITVQSCSGGTLGAPFLVDASSTPLARGNGSNGTTAVETYIPNSFLPATGQKMRIGITTLGADGLSGADALTLNGTGPILVDGPPLVVVPTMAKLSLALTALLLAVSVWYARRRGWHGTQLVVVAAFAISMSGQLIAAIVRDGFVGDWSGIAPAATDPAGDAPPGTDITNIYSTVDNGNVYFRIDTTLNAPPAATAQTVTAIVGQPLSITLTGTDYESSPLTFTVLTQPTQGVLTGTAPNLTYTPNAAAAASDSFTFKVNDGSLDSAPATVTLGTNRAPAITSANSATFVPTQANSFTVVANGIPAPTTAVGTCAPALPATITFTANAIGGGVIAGNPTPAQAGVYVCPITSSNGVSPNATQSFTLTIGGGPAITSVTTLSVPELAPFTHSVTTSSVLPITAMALTTGTLPTGANFAYAGPPATTATISGTPAVCTRGSYPVVLSATNSVGTTTQNFNLTVRPVNQAPSFVKGADVTVLEDAVAQTVAGWATARSAGAPCETTQTLSFEITANTNAALFSAAPAVNGTNGDLTFTPAANANGTATITLRIKDNGGVVDGGVDTSATQSFVINVTAVNDAPSFTKGADQTVLQNAGAQAVANWATAISAGPADEAAQTLTFTVTNSNNALFSVQPAIAPNGTLTYTPAANANGTAIITVILKDSGGTANGGADTAATQTFTIGVTAVNLVPSFTKGADVTVLEDAAAYSAPWATAISAGSPSEVGQILNFIVTNGNNALFSVQPAVSPTGVLSFTTAPNANGSAVVSVSLHDNGGTANGGVDTSAVQSFNINVTAVNDAPSFTRGANITVIENSGAFTQASWATALSAGPADESGQTLSFVIASNSNPGLFSSQPAVSPTGGLSFTPTAGQSGVATVGIQIKDNGGTANGGVDTSATQTFTITVTGINHVPSFTKGADQTVLEDAAAQTVAGWATAISDGDGNTQTLAFQVTNNTNAALFSAGPAIAANGTLTFTPAANANGSATITVNLKDNGGTANGGVDTSAAQTFNINVAAVNDAPSFIKGADQTLSNAAGAVTVPGWATSISAGPADESPQTLVFNVTGNTNPGLFTAGPAVSSTGVLTFTPNPASTGGLATVTLTLQDNGGTASGGVNTSPPQSFTITVQAAPAVTTNPTSQSISAGSPVTFTAAATGTPTPTVQWVVSTDGGATFSNVAGATSTALTFTTSVADNAKQFKATFTNLVGTATTTSATLTVTAGPVITTNPVDVTVNAGGTAVFTAAATGTPTPTVQWQFSTDGGATFANVAGAITTTLTVPAVTAGQNGTKFRAVFTNGSGSATTTVATMTVNFAPTVTTNPLSQTVSAGSNVTFTAAASGNPTPTVQWQQSTDAGATFTNIVGATSTTLSLTAVAVGQSGNQYRAVFTNTVGSATTTAATLTVTAGPVITTNPVDVTVNAGGTAVFNAAATGTPTPTVQWQFSTDGGATFANVAGAITTTLTVPAVTAGQNGTKFRAVFTNASGSATTTAATMTVNFAPAVTTNPTNQSVNIGSNATFTSAASGNPTPTVQWQVSTDGGVTFNNVAGATSTTLTFTPTIADNNNRYRAVFTNSVGSATSTAATLNVVLAPPVVTTSVGTTTFTEDGPAVIVDSALTVTQAGATNLVSGTVSIFANFLSAEDSLTFVNQNGIVGSYASATGILTLTGASTVANYQAALRSITYGNSSQNPSVLSRTVRFVVNNGTSNSAAADKTVGVNGVNDAPVLATGSTLNYTENGAPVAINAVITVFDIDSPNLIGATVSITNGYVAGQDVLSYATALGISGSFNAGVLTLSGTTTVANYQTALRNVLYSNLSNDPSNGTAATTSRTIGYQVNDGGAVNNLSNIVSSTVNVTAVNNPPIATALSGLYAQAGIQITYPAGTLGGTDLEAGTTVTVVTTPDSQCASCQLTINANGGFTFTPPQSAAGTTVNFTYHVMDNGNPGSGVAGTSVTVSLNVSGPAIYFVKSAAVGAGNCNLGTECTLATAVTNIGASINARIFLNDSNPHSGGVSLNAGGWLVGLGTTGTTFDALFGIAPSGTGTLATRPTLGAARPTVQGTVSLNTNSSVRGLNVSTGAATGMNDPAAAITGVTVSEVSVTTTTGTAVNLNGTGGTLTFTSISSNGAANGISLTSTTGSFTVTGAGGICTVATPTCSGGSIQSSTGAGILIATSAQSINLNSMKIQNSGTRGIQTTGVNGFTLDNSIVTDSAGTATDDGLNMANTSGTLTISNSAIANAPHNGMTVDNFNTNMTAFNFTNNTISCAAGQPCQPSGSIGNDGLLLVMRGTSVLPSGVVSGSTFSGVRAVGVQIQTNDSGRIGVNSGAPGTFALTTGNSFVVQNNTFTGNGQGIDMGTSQVSNMTFQVLNNTIVGKLTSPGAIANTASSHAINAFTAAGNDTGTASHTFMGKIDGNIIGTQGVKDSGSGFGAGIRVVVQGNNTQGVVTVNNNTIREAPNSNIMNFFGQNGAANTATQNANSAKFKITNNTMPAPSGSNLSLCGPANTPCAEDGIFVLADDATPVCNVITGNNIYDITTTFGGVFDIYLAERLGPKVGAQLTVEGTGSVSGFVLANNTLAGVNKFVDEGANTSLVAAGTCGTFP